MRDMIWPFVQHGTSLRAVLKSLCPCHYSRLLYNVVIFLILLGHLVHFLLGKCLLSQYYKSLLLLLCTVQYVHLVYPWCSAQFLFFHY